MAARGKSLHTPKPSLDTRLSTLTPTLPWTRAIPPASSQTRDSSRPSCSQHTLSQCVQPLTLNKPYQNIKPSKTMTNDLYTVGPKPCTVNQTESICGPHHRDLHKQRHKTLNAKPRVPTHKCSPQTPKCFTCCYASAGSQLGQFFQTNP